MKKILGFTGPIGSGKDLAAKYVGEKLRIPFFQISDALKKLMEKRGVEVNRDTFTTCGTEYAKEFGEDYLAKILLEKIDGGKGVISGMRQVAQIKYLRENSDFYLVAIGADAEIRFQRSMARGKAGDADTLDLFVRNELKENTAEKNIQRVFECVKMADILIINNTSLEDLYKELDELLVKIDF